MTSISGMLGWECMGKGRTRRVQVHPCSEKQRSDHNRRQLQWVGGGITWQLPKTGACGWWNCAKAPEDSKPQPNEAAGV